MFIIEPRFIPGVDMTSHRSRSSRSSLTERKPIQPALQTLLLTLPPTRPRNPLVAAAQMRKAGSHQPSRGAMRAAERRSLRAELHDVASRGSPAGDP
jgi:hypothetical protein